MFPRVHMCTFLATTIAVFAAYPAFGAEYTIDQSHSSTVFKVNHLGAANVYGMIPGISGTVTFDPTDVSKNAIDISVDTTTVSTFNAGRDNHLSGPDFFNAKQFPAITFKSTSWKEAGEGSYEVAGDLTMLGVTKPVTVTAVHIGNGKDRRGNELIGFESTFTVDRKEFGMNYGVAEEGGLGKDVTITIAIECAKQ